MREEFWLSWLLSVLLLHYSALDEKNPPSRTLGFLRLKIFLTLLTGVNLLPSRRLMQLKTSGFLPA